METVSFNHSQLIREAGEKVSIPSFDKNAILIMHKKMRDKLWNDIMKDEDENSILKKMAVSEESVGKLYLAISTYYQNLSEAYKNVSTEIQQIAQEEFEHRERIIKTDKVLTINHLIFSTCCQVIDRRGVQKINLKNLLTDL